MTPFERIARNHIASRGSPGTRELYTADLARWLLFCQLGSHNADAPTLEAAVAFRDDLQTKLGDQTVRRILSALSSMYDAAGILNQFKSSKRLPRPSPDDVALTKEYSQEEAEALLAAAEKESSPIGVRDYAVLRILYDTGMRISSVVSLRLDQIYTRADGVQAIITKVKKKGRVEIELPATSNAALLRWRAIADEASRYVFPASRGDGPLTRRAINSRLVTYGARAGVKDAAPHRFRATYITEALDAGIPPHEVQASVHHSDPKTTQRYDRHKRGTGVTAAVAEFRKGKKA